jgi:oligopeptide/dipeptide ABC transporter ATP-binding protein
MAQTLPEPVHGNDLSVTDLRVGFSGAQGLQEAVRGVSFDVPAGTCVALIGESGCGKSATALAIVDLLPPNGRFIAGSVQLGEDEITSAKGTRPGVRGRRVAIVLQDSMAALNPVLTIATQLCEDIRRHFPVSKKEARERALALLAEVGMPDARRVMRLHPHELSGGQRQRVSIAIALAGNPEFVIGDEPTTALDVTVQAQILDLLRREQDARRMGMIFITHDLGVAARIADHIVVMYAGRVIERAACDELFADPLHPYTRGLLASIPRVDGASDETLPTIPGSPPALSDVRAGCAFAPRCSEVMERCWSHDPALAGAERHPVACWARNPDAPDGEVRPA